MIMENDTENKMNKIILYMDELKNNRRGKQLHEEA